MSSLLNSYVVRLATRVAISGEGVPVGAPPLRFVQLCSFRYRVPVGSFTLGMVVGQRKVVRPARRVRLPALAAPRVAGHRMIHSWYFGDVQWGGGEMNLSLNGTRRALVGSLLPVACPSSYG